jgi:hypothetical protein
VTGGPDELGEHNADALARRERARRLREQIGESGSDRPPASPREFTERAAREAAEADRDA